MTTLNDEIEKAAAWLESLKLRALTATCQEIGSHDWQSTGGANCGCVFMYIDDDHTQQHVAGQCSVPVYTCTRCGDCDYGRNDEATDIRKRCREERTR